MTEPTPPPAPDPPLAPPNDGLTIEQSAVIAQATFKPSIQRMSVILNALIQLTGNGDYALWAPLSLLDHTFRDLKWDQVAPADAKRFAAVAALVLRRYTDHIEAYRDAVFAYVAAAQTGPPRKADPFPVLHDWTLADTEAVYDEVSRTYPDLAAPKEPADV